MDDKKNNQVALYNEEIKRELADPAAARALLATTFKGLTDLSMRQALLEGMLRGFTIKQFLQRDVYALPFNQGAQYSLVTSIDLARKRGARGGVTGKSKPLYEESEDRKKPVTCSVTVYTRDGHPDGYTATVEFEEYFKPGMTKNGRYIPSMWEQKPRTMIAKVAEMHALRMACPEELSQIYLEEEFDTRVEVPASRIKTAPDAVETSGLKMKDLKKKNHDKKDEGAPEDSDEAAGAEGVIDA